MNRHVGTICSLLALVIVPVMLAGPARGQSSGKKFNVLFMAVDDMNNDLGCYGSALVKSPNIDRIASQGLKFEHAYCQFPLCSPSRSSLMTGLRPDTTRVFNLQYHFRQGLPDVVTLPQMFMRNGYYVARVGKIYHYGNPGDIGTNGLDDKVSWQERFNPAGRDRTALEIDVMNYTPHRGLGSAMAFYADPTGTDVQHTDGKVADQTIALLEKHKDRPFFIGCGFYKPHTPWITPRKYFDLYSIDDIKLPPIHGGNQIAVPGACTLLDPAVALLRREARRGPRMQAGLLRRDLIRRCPDRPRARRGRPARPGRQHDHRLLERSRVSPRRAWALVQAELFRRGLPGAADHPDAGHDDRRQVEPAAGGTG